MKTKIRNSIRRLLLIPLVFVCFALSPRAQAVVPAPDGGYPGQNTAEGTQALFSLTTGIFNTADGFHALFHETNGSSNVAVGSQALFSDVGGNNNTAVGDHALFLNEGGQLGSDNTAIGLTRSVTTKPAAPTRPPVFTHSSVTPPASSTQPLVIKHSIQYTRHHQH